MQPRSTRGGWWRWVRLTVMEPWQLFGSIALIAAVFALGMLINHARLMESPTGRSGQLVSLIGPSSQPFVDTAPPAVTPSDEPSPQAQMVGPTGGAPPPAASVSSRPSAKATVKPAPRPTTSHSPPAAILHVSPVSGSAPLSVVADASASSGVNGARIVSYVFDFGDGSARVGPQSGATASHWYDVAGEYSVTVIVTDSNGLASADVTTIIIT